MRRFEQTTQQRKTTSRLLDITTTTRPLGQSPARQRGKLVPLLIVGTALLISAVIVLISTGMGALLPMWPFGGSGHPAISGAVAPRQAIVGRVFFVSSGQIREDSSQGIADEVQVDLNGIPNPAPGKAYYAWLRNDDPVEGQAVLLGQLPVSHGTARLRYSGDQQHTNLLDFADRFLVTEEGGGAAPTVPSPDRSTWRYTALIPHTPNPQDTVHHFSLLDHLRHLLASDPTLKTLGLPGGLDIWLFRNSQKILEWSGAARDDWARQNPDLMHRQFIRILDYLDGLNFIQNDVPPGSPVLVDAHVARVGLLQLDANQEPPGYLHHIGVHLQGIVQSPGSSAEQHSLAAQINVAISKVQALLEQVRKDAVQLVNMGNTQLLQPAGLSILDSMVKQSQDAFLGQFDPATGEIQGGVTQIHYAIERLATLDVYAAGA